MFHMIFMWFYFEEKMDICFLLQEHILGRSVNFTSVCYSMQKTMMLTVLIFE